jgi:hypothetical protein
MSTLKIMSAGIRLNPISMYWYMKPTKVMLTLEAFNNRHIPLDLRMIYTVAPAAIARKNKRIRVIDMISST